MHVQNQRLWVKLCEDRNFKVTTNNSRYKTSYTLHNWSQDLQHPLQQGLQARRFVSRRYFSNFLNAAFIFSAVFGGALGTLLCFLNEIAYMLCRPLFKALTAPSEHCALLQI